MSEIVTTSQIQSSGQVAQKHPEWHPTPAPTRPMTPDRPMNRLNEDILIVSTTRNIEGADYRDEQHYLHSTDYQTMDGLTLNEHINIQPITTATPTACKRRSQVDDISFFIPAS